MVLFKLLLYYLLLFLFSSCISPLILNLCYCYTHICHGIRQFYFAATGLNGIPEAVKVYNLPNYVFLHIIRSSRQLFFFVFFFYPGPFPYALTSRPLPTCVWCAWKHPAGIQSTSISNFCYIVTSVAHIFT